jgi:hypothetical protein
MPTIGGGDDFVWIGGPEEGLWRSPSIRLHSNVTPDRLRPVRLVTETDLPHWADRRDGQSMLPELVRRFILAERGYFPELRFASDDSVLMHGWVSLTGTTSSDSL